MRIVTWNINSVRLRISLLQELINQQQPDVICLQETKTQDEFFPHQAFIDSDYKHIYCSGQKSYNGVAILSKFPIENKFSLEFYNGDKRHVAAKINGVEIHNFYVPAGGDIPDISLNIKFKHKLEYLDLAKKWFLSNRTKEDKIIILGDLNIAPYEHDVWSSKQLRNIVSHTDIERAKLIEFLTSLDFIDSARHFIPLSEKYYTWWSYRNKDWESSHKGRRLDHIWVSDNIKDLMTSIHLLKIARNWPQPSDHVPYILDIKSS